MSETFDDNSSISHYRIVSKIGAGGMGEVYLAQDTKLDRRVALKILPPEFAEDKERMTRFVREAKSASALNHPNIITIHEIGESEGTHFIATEFIDGKTLNEFAKHDLLNLKSALEIAIQIASALDEAHSAGIVHRDIKPDNVMIRANGLVKILDFGIAKLSTPSETNEEAATAIQGGTMPGMIIGTPQFMSPEQARGKGVDHQTDIFSFGVVLYEMLAGDSPFAGETVSDIIAAVLTKEPKPLADIPIELADIVDKTLQKDKQNRYQTAKDLLHDLKEVKQELEIQSRLGRNSAPNLEEPKTQILKAQTTAESETQNSIAVMPFTNMSADEENEYFCDGLAEELLNALSKIDELKVAARTSAFSFKGKNANVGEIGEKLSVKNVLEGSVRKSENKLRISVQLINAADGYQLWSERYDREMKDIFDVQDEIALAIVDALKLKLFGDEKAAVLKKGTENEKAYELYLKGRFYWNKRTAESLKRAAEYFKQAIEQDPNYALAFAGLAETYALFSQYSVASPKDSMPQAKAMALRALEIDEQLAEAHAALGQYLNYFEYDSFGAEKELRRAIELNPNYATAYHWLGHDVLAPIKRFDEALIEMKRAEEIDPISPVISMALGHTIFFTRRYDEAIAQYKRTLSLNPNFSFARFTLGWVFYSKGMYGQAISEYREALESGYDSLVTGYLALALAKSGERDEAVKLLNQLKLESTQSYVLSYAIAIIHLGLDEIDDAFVWLEKDVAERSAFAVYYAVNPELDDLRGDPRFQDIIGRIGFPTDKTNQTAESLEAQTVLLKSTTAGDKQNKIAPEIAEKSVAVLPFTDMSADGDQEYFCNGLAEELLNALAKIDELKVAARTSAFSFKGKNTNVSEIGEKLSVKNVLEGSVRRSGNKLRISVQLINAADGFHLWSERYDREMQDIFDVQDEIALAVVDALKLKLFGDEKAVVLEHYTNNTEAYELYLKGRYHANRFTVDGFHKAIKDFNQSIALDSHYALAYTGMADAYYHAATFHLSPGEAFLSMKTAALKALELDDALAEAHTLLALFTANYDRQPLEAEAGFKRGVVLAPNNVMTHQYYGLYLALMGRFDEAIAEFQRAQKLDPLSLVVSFLLGWTYYYARQPEKVLAEARKALEIEPNFWMTHWNMALGYEQRGQYTEALASLETAKSLDDSLWIPAVMARVYARLGRKDEAKKILDELTEKSNRQWVAPYLVATAYVNLEQRDQAFEWLEKASEEYDEWIQCLKVDPTLDPIRSDSRFHNLVQRMGFPTDKTNQTDESLEAKTVMLSTGEATLETPAKDLETENAETKPTTEPATNAKSEIQKPKSKWWLFGLLSLIVLVGGFFGYKYFTPNKQIESIAVMPFVNESGNDDNDYLSDGMTETLIGSLSQLPNLNVKARSSVFRYKGKELDPKKIASELNVQAILTGRVMQRGEQLTLSLELIDAQTENVIWSESYNRKQTDLVTLQSEIARDVSSKLKTKLSGANEAKVTKNYTANPEAYKLYLKGRFYWNKRTAESLKQAVEFYKQAIEIDPKYALAYSGLAESYVLFPQFSVSLPKDSLPQAKAAALRALELDDSLAEAHTALGEYLNYFEWDRAGAEKEFRRAIELNPNYATAHNWLGIDLLAPTKRFDEAIAELKRAEELDPLSPMIGANLGVAILFTRQYDEAIAQYKRVLSLDPNFAFARFNLGGAFHSKGMYTEAITEYRKSLELSDNPFTKGFLALSLAKSGQRDEAIELLNQLKQESGERYVPSYAVAIVYIGLNEKEEAFGWLEKDVAEHSFYASYYAVSPELDDVRSDPRFKEMLKRMNLPE